MSKAIKSVRKSKKKTSDAVAILKNRYVDRDAAMAGMVEEERANMQIARTICDIRAKAGLSQRQLAARVGTTASVICRLEDADYEGHSLSMLRKIAAALDQRVEVRFLPARKQKQSA